jgi:hydrogenase 3 maturation protease
MVEWKACLQRMIALAERVAIIGVGNSLQGDDGAGQALIALLREHLPVNQHILLLDGGTAPENLTGKLRRFQPDLVLIVDAAWMEEQGGSIRVLDPDRLEGVSFSSHTLPLSMLTHYLRSELGCEVLLIGIQPLSLAEGEHLTLLVEQAVDQLAGMLSSLLHGFHTVR